MRNNRPNATVEQQLDLIGEYLHKLPLANNNPPGGRLYFGDERRNGFSLKVERAWAVSCSLRVRVNYGPGAEASISTELSWSSTARDLAGAFAAIALYTEMANVAATVQAMCGNNSFAAGRYFVIDEAGKFLDRSGGQAFEWREAGCWSEIADAESWFAARTAAGTEINGTIYDVHTGKRVDEVFK